MTTPTPLERLYKTKLALLAILMTVVGVALLFLSSALHGVAGWEWLATEPVADLGSALFTSGLIVVGIEYIDRRDAEQRALERLRLVMQEQAPMLRDTVIQGFAVEPETLAKVASPATLDKVVQNSLSVQLGDKDLAHDVYDDLKEQVIRSPERWRDVAVSISLAPWAGGPASGVGSMFEATVRWEYRTRLTNSTQRFSCVSDQDEYRALLRDPTSTLVWYFEPVKELTAASPETFELTQFSIDGKSCPIRKGKRVRSQTFTADTETASTPGDAREVVVSYTYRVLVQRHSHMLQLDVAKPAKGLRVHFAYGDCGIRHVNVLDFIAGAKQPRISRSSAGNPKATAEVAFDEWVWPKSGVGFCWVLEAELW